MNLCSSQNYPVIYFFNTQNKCELKKIEIKQAKDIPQVTVITSFITSVSKVMRDTVSYILLYDFRIQRLFHLWDEGQVFFIFFYYLGGDKRLSSVPVSACSSPL